MRTAALLALAVPALSGYGDEACLQSWFSTERFGAKVDYEKGVHEYEAVVGQLRGTVIREGENAFAGLAGTATMLDRDRICDGLCKAETGCIFWQQSSFKETTEITEGSCLLYNDYAGLTYAPENDRCDMRAGFVHYNGCSVYKLQNSGDQAKTDAGKTCTQAACESTDVKNKFHAHWTTGGDGCQICWLKTCESTDVNPPTCGYGLGKLGAIHGHNGYACPKDQCVDALFTYDKDTFAVFNDESKQCKRCSKESPSHCNEEKCKLITGGTWDATVENGLCNMCVYDNYKDCPKDKCVDSLFTTSEDLNGHKVGHAVWLDAVASGFDELQKVGCNKCRADDPGNVKGCDEASCAKLLPAGKFLWSATTGCNACDGTNGAGLIGTSQWTSYQNAYNKCPEEKCVDTLFADSEKATAVWSATGGCNKCVLEPAVNSNGDRSKCTETSCKRMTGAHFWKSTHHNNGPTDGKCRSCSENSPACSFDPENPSSLGCCEQSQCIQDLVPANTVGDPSVVWDSDNNVCIQTCVKDVDQAAQLAWCPEAKCNWEGAIFEGGKCYKKCSADTEGRKWCPQSMCTVEKLGEGTFWDATNNECKTCGKYGKEKQCTKTLCTDAMFRGSDTNSRAVAVWKTEDKCSDPLAEDCCQQCSKDSTWGCNEASCTLALWEGASDKPNSVTWKDSSCKKCSADDSSGCTEAQCTQAMFDTKNDGSIASWKSNSCKRCHRDSPNNCDEAGCAKVTGGIWDLDMSGAKSCRICSQQNPGGCKDSECTDAKMPGAKWENGSCETCRLDRQDKCTEDICKRITTADWKDLQCQFCTSDGTHRCTEKTCKDSIIPGAVWAPYAHNPEGEKSCKFCSESSIHVCTEASCKADLLSDGVAYWNPESAPQGCSKCFLKDGYLSGCFTEEHCLSDQHLIKLYWRPTLEDKNQRCSKDPPTKSPTKAPTGPPTPPTKSPTKAPTTPTPMPTRMPTKAPTKAPTLNPEKAAFLKKLGCLGAPGNGWQAFLEEKGIAVKIPDHAGMTACLHLKGQCASSPMGMPGGGNIFMTGNMGYSVREATSTMKDSGEHKGDVELKFQSFSFCVSGECTSNKYVAIETRDGCWDASCKKKVILFAGSKEDREAADEGTFTSHDNVSPVFIDNVIALPDLQGMLNTCSDVCTAANPDSTVGKPTADMASLIGTVNGNMCQCLGQEYNDESCHCMPTPGMVCPPCEGKSGGCLPKDTSDACRAALYAAAKDGTNPSGTWEERGSCWSKKMGIDTLKEYPSDWAEQLKRENRESEIRGKCDPGCLSKGAKVKELCPAELAGKYDQEKSSCDSHAAWKAKQCKKGDAGCYQIEKYDGANENDGKFSGKCDDGSTWNRASWNVMADGNCNELAAEDIGEKKLGRFYKASCTTAGNLAFSGLCNEGCTKCSLEYLYEDQPDSYSQAFKSDDTCVAAVGGDTRWSFKVTKSFTEACPSVKDFKTGPPPPQCGLCDGMGTVIPDNAVTVIRYVDTDDGKSEVKEATCKDLLGGLAEKKPKSDWEGHVSYSCKKAKEFAKYVPTCCTGGKCGNTDLADFGVGGTPFASGVGTAYSAKVDVAMGAADAATEVFCKEGDPVCATFGIFPIQDCNCEGASTMMDDSGKRNPNHWGDESYSKNTYAMDGKSGDFKDKAAIWYKMDGACHFGGKYGEFGEMWELTGTYYKGTCDANGKMSLKIKCDSTCTKCGLDFLPDNPAKPGVCTPSMRADQNDDKGLLFFYENNHMFTGTCASVVQPTPAVVTNAPTKLPTPAPTLYPTLAPTPEATNPPKPVFVADAAEFKVDALKEIQKAAKANPSTDAPTKSPTKHPTMVGYAVVEQEEEVKVIEAAVKLEITEEEAKAPAMINSIETGLADSLGFDADAVKVTHINNVPVAGATSRLRRLAGGVDITFTVESASSKDSAVADLQASLETAATEGSVVANVQKQAAKKGVLSDSLAAMERKLPKPTVKKTTMKKKVSVMVRSNTPAPTTLAPTKPPTTSEEHISVGAATQPTFTLFMGLVTAGAIWLANV